ncbi:MAG: outer membrane protein OmpA-like peptidoglycan-associated protein [Kiritimatiellia bacterium]|jgi:outer membrane protein OmpA-like peptidoglycan-associated protein
MDSLIVVHRFHRWLEGMTCPAHRVAFPFIGVAVLFSSFTFAASSITYATRIDAVTWAFSGSKFNCQLTHSIDNFGMAVFERRAGVPTRFFLQSQSPRMKSGQADLFSQPPGWLSDQAAEKIASVNVRHGETPVTIKRKISERMLAELYKGMDLHVVRQPWYGDKQSLTVVVPSVGFGKTYTDYLGCLGNLLSVNFSQVKKKSLYYSDDEDYLNDRTRAYLEKVASYIKEDPAIQAIYIDGHADSGGIRNENLIRSKERTQRIVDYLVEQGVSQNLMIARWHGERYQVATNKTKKGKAKNRRVTLRLSKEPANTVMKLPQDVKAPPERVEIRKKELEIMENIGAKKQKAETEK